MYVRYNPHTEEGGVSENDDIFDGSWNAATLGEFLSILVDSGDPVVLFRVDDEERVTDTAFTRTYEIVTVPAGAIREEIANRQIARVNKVLAAFLYEHVMG